VTRSTGNTTLMGLADRPGPDITARLLLALTALYVERPTHTVEERRQYVELALRLIDKVDASARAQVANLLAGHAAAPAEIRERLGGAHATAAGQLLHNETAAPGAGLQSGAVTHTDDPALSDRRQTSGVDLGEAFFAGGAEERRRILSQFAASPDAASDGNVEPASSDLEASERHVARVDAAAMAGRIGEFVRHFAGLLSIPKSLCERILNDPSGEPMVIAAKAAALPVSVLQRILLLVNPAVSHSVQRVYDLTDLFHDIDRSAAIRLMSSWRARAAAGDAAAAQGSEPGEAASLASREGAALRSRFGALAERVRGEGTTKTVSGRPDPGNAVRRDPRSR
jgi:hypothetical protein